MKFNKKEKEVLVEEGDLLDEVVDDISYFYFDPKKKKPDRWYSRLLSARNISLAFLLFIVGATCIGAYENSVYFKGDTPKNYLTPTIKKEINFWNTTDDALNYASESYNVFLNAFENLEILDSTKNFYKVPRDYQSVLTNTFAEFNNRYSNLMEILDRYKNGDKEVIPTLKLEGDSSPTIEARTPENYILYLKDFYKNDNPKLNPEVFSITSLFSWFKCPSVDIGEDIAWKIDKTNYEKIKSVLTITQGATDNFYQKEIKDLSALMDFAKENSDYYAYQRGN